jgi:hypothetical protein
MAPPGFRLKNPAGMMKARYLTLCYAGLDSVTTKQEKIPAVLALICDRA